MPKVLVAQTFTKHTYFLYIKRVKGIRPMSLSKVQVQNVVRQTVNDCGEKLNREQKWQVFINVCDNLLKEGRITTAQHSRWTLPF